MQEHILVECFNHLLLKLKNINYRLILYSHLCVVIHHQGSGRGATYQSMDNHNDNNASLVCYSILFFVLLHNIN